MSKLGNSCPELNMDAAFHDDMSVGMDQACTLVEELFRRLAVNASVAESVNIAKVKSR
jgi:hypothetical protein